MQSRISCFNPTLLRKNLTRFWPLWGLASFVGVLFPLALLLDFIRRGPRAVPSAAEFSNMYYSVVAGALPVVSLGYAILCAMVVWSYLYSARSVSLMHTLPIRREGLFATNFLSGMAMMLLPYAVTGALCVAISLGYGCFDIGSLLTTILVVIGESTVPSVARIRAPEPGVKSYCSKSIMPINPWRILPSDCVRSM